MSFAKWAAISILLAVVTGNLRARAVSENEESIQLLKNQPKEKRSPAKKISFNFVLDKKAMPQLKKSYDPTQHKAVFRLKHLEMDVEDVNREPKRNKEFYDCTTKRKQERCGKKTTRSVLSQANYPEEPTTPLSPSNHLFTYHYDKVVKSSTKESLSFSGNGLPVKHQKERYPPWNSTKSRKFSGPATPLRQNEMFDDILEKDIKKAKDYEDVPDDDDTEDDGNSPFDSDFKNEIYLEQDERESNEKIPKSTVSLGKIQDDEQASNADSDETLPSLDYKDDKEGSRSSADFDEDADEDDDETSESDESSTLENLFSADEDEEDEKDEEDSEDLEVTSIREAFIDRKHHFKGADVLEVKVNLKGMPKTCLRVTPSSEFNRFDKEKQIPFTNQKSDQESQQPFESRSSKTFRTPSPTVRMKKITTRNFVRNNRKKLLQQLKKNDEGIRMPTAKSRDFDKSRNRHLKGRKESFRRSEIISANARLKLQTERYSSRNKLPVIILTEAKSYTSPSIKLKYESNSFKNPNALVDLKGSYLSTSAPYDKRPSQKCPVEPTNPKMTQNSVQPTSDSSLCISESGSTNGLLTMSTCNDATDINDFRENGKHPELAQESVMSHESEDQSKEEYDVETDRTSNKIKGTSPKT